MAFENPFLRQSSVRNSALDYLFSDEPEGDSVQAPTPSNNFADTPAVDQAFGLSENNATIGSIAANIAANEGSYNAEVGTSIAPMGAVETMNAFSTYGPAINSIAKQMGIPSGFIGLAHQSAANTIDAQMATMGGVTSGQNNLGLTGMGVAAGMMGGPLGMLAGLGLGALGKNSDTMANTAAFAGNFTTQAQMDGYISAATNPAMQATIASMITDPTTITPAQYGTLASYVASQDTINSQNTISDNALAAQAQAQAQAQAAVTSPVDMSFSPSTPIAPMAVTSPVDMSFSPSTPIGPMGMVSADSSGGSASGADIGAAPGDGISMGVDAGIGGPSGGGGGGGKIICTAMNHAYGFGSFRNAIWIAYADKHLTKAHEVGYHTLFLPLVDFGFKQGDGKLNLAVRKVLEWGTRHRSTDLRAELRNTKRDTTGRIIRFIFEPVCYAVGKLKGF